MVKVCKRISLLLLATAPSKETFEVLAQETAASQYYGEPGSGALPKDRLISFGRMTIVVLLLAVSPLTLVLFNWQYFESGGGPLDKFHPATLLSALLLAWTAFHNRNPFTGLIELGQRNAALLPFVLANVYMIWYAGSVLNLPVTIFIETYLGAAMVYMLFRNLDEDSGRTLALLVHALLFINAVLAFYEVFTGYRLTPLVINGEILVDEPRATALIGHPLANAMIAGAYVVIFASGGGRDLPAFLRPICFVVALASLVPFGGRAATATALLSLVLLGARQFWTVLHGARFNKISILWALIIVPVACLTILVMSELGALDVLKDRIFDDDGSASTRIEMFELFKYLSFNDLLFGPDPNVLTTWIRLHGLDYGIESFIIAFVLNFGLVSTVIFMPPLMLFFYQLVKTGRRGSGLAVMYFLVVAITSISLSSKSPTLAMFALILLILLRREPQQAEP